jgi:hypothetical protein
MLVVLLKNIHDIYQLYIACYILSDQSVICHLDNNDVGRDSSVGIATCYGLDSMGIESRWGRDFPHPSKLALGTTQPPLH